ncbi:Cro/CI family transcriptional regulator [Rahnella sp. R3(2024)]|uniref:Cro/CI family transcriptional regulator n=1 Tax=Rahnella sp. R3(2024) TaxID=3163550 RepID=UPI0036ED48CA
MFKSDVLKHFGGTSKAASALDISHSAVCQWGNVIPEKQAMKVERITKGKIKYVPSMYEKASTAGAQP